MSGARRDDASLLSSGQAGAPLAVGDRL